MESNLLRTHANVVFLETVCSIDSSVACDPERYWKSLTVVRERFKITEPTLDIACCAADTYKKVSARRDDLSTIQFETSTSQTVLSSAAAFQDIPQPATPGKLSETDVELPLVTICSVFSYKYGLRLPSEWPVVVGPAYLKAWWTAIVSWGSRSRSPRLTLTCNFGLTPSSQHGYYTEGDPLIEESSSSWEESSAGDDMSIEEGYFSGELSSIEDNSDLNLPSQDDATTISSPDGRDTAIESKDESPSGHELL